jgi:hypothetical protein
MRASLRQEYDREMGMRNLLLFCMITDMGEFLTSISTISPAFDFSQEQWIWIEALKTRVVQV